ncbi:hypothetical protein GCM10010278_83080 [Streptomyces melanogenes]|nr:hypothetical protein GCM10010278_83080 [Streptomyces melanogenes]
MVLFFLDGESGAEWPGEVHPYACGELHPYPDPMLGDQLKRYGETVQGFSVAYEQERRPRST